MRLLLRAAVSFFAALPTHCLAQYDPGETDPLICDALSNGRFAEAIGRFEEIARQGGAPSDQANYCGASLYLQAHLPDKAEGPLSRISPAFRSWSGWPTPGDLRARVEGFKAARPDQLTEDLFVERRTRWNAPLLKELPAFLRTGRRIFGPDLPRVRFFLFATDGLYKRFYRPVMNADMPNSWHDGTGNLHIVLFRQTSTRPAGTVETLGNVIHEFGHAWWNTYTMTRHNKEYLRIVKPYMDEGFADYLAGMWNRRYLMIRFARVRQAAEERVRPPRFSELRTHAGGSGQFYDPERAALNYDLSAVLVARMLGAQGGGKIPRVLDALATTGDDLQAWRAIGKDAEAEYDKLVHSLWRTPRKKTRQKKHG